MLVTGCWILVTGLLDTGYRFAGYWLLVTGLLVTGYWFTGYWLLVCWLLVAGYCVLIGSGVSWCIVYCLLSIVCGLGLWSVVFFHISFLKEAIN